MLQKDSGVIIKRRKQKEDIMEEKNNFQEENLDLDLEKFDFDEEEEEFEDEYEFKPRKRPTRLIAGIATVAVVILAIWFFFLRGNAVTPDMANWSRYEVDNWGSSNNVEITYLYEYSETSENYVISQSVPSGTKVKNGLEITVTISEGLDPNELIEVIDIENSTSSELESWIDQNGLRNVELKYAYNPLVPENHVVSFEFKTGSQTNFLRKDALTIEISRGASTNEDKVTLPDLVEMTLNEALAWGENNSITINVTYTFSEYTLADKIISQDTEEGTKVSDSDIISILVSKGPQIVVPDFSDYTIARVQKWALENNITVEILNEYSGQVEAGYFIMQNLSKDEIISVKDSITVTYSLGKIDIYSYVGQQMLVMKNALDLLNLNGANITYNFEYLFSPSFPDGVIIDHSFKNTEMSPGSIMNVIVSKGNAVFVPDYSGMDLDQILQASADAGVEVSFIYRHYPAPVGAFISQSIEEGTVISEDEPVIITMSMGPA